VWLLDTSYGTLEAAGLSDRQWYGDWIVDTFEQFLSRPLSQFSSRYCSVSAGRGAKRTCAPISGGQTGLVGGAAKNLSGALRPTIFAPPPPVFNIYCSTPGLKLQSISLYFACHINTAVLQHKQAVSSLRERKYNEVTAKRISTDTAPNKTLKSLAISIIIITKYALLPHIIYKLVTTLQEHLKSEMPTHAGVRLHGARGGFRELEACAHWVKNSGAPLHPYFTTS